MLDYLAWVIQILKWSTLSLYPSFHNHWLFFFKVRQKLLSKELSMEKSEKAKKLRAMKKYGKKVQ